MSYSQSVCLSACLCLSLLCIHTLAAYSTSVIHENCRSKRRGQRERVQEEDEGGGGGGAVTKCSLIILHSLFFHPPFPPFCLLIKLHLLSFFFFSVHVSPLFFWLHFHSFTLFFFAFVFFFFLLFFFWRGGRRRRREEEWRVAMATASWLQATCSLHHSVRKRERDGVKERRRDVSSSLSHLCFFVFLSTNPNEKTENPTGNESD